MCAGIITQLLCEILTSGGSDGKRWNLDGFDKHGYAAIHYIVMKKHSNKPALLEALIINGAYVDLTCQQGLTAIHLAAQVCCCVNGLAISFIPFGKTLNHKICLSDAVGLMA